MSFFFCFFVVDVVDVCVGSGHVGFVTEYCCLHRGFYYYIRVLLYAVHAARINVSLVCFLNDLSFFFKSKSAEDRSVLSVFHYSMSKGRMDI